MMKYSDPDKAFERAIALRVLSEKPDRLNYAGAFMYMGDDASGDHLFKSKVTRQYLPPVKAVS